jgi:putative methyltransferase (TIGR04325 family)
MIEFFIRALMFLLKKITKPTFKGDFKSLEQCLHYLNESSCAHNKFPYTKEKNYERWIDIIVNNPHQIKDHNFILALWNLISKKNTVLDWGGGVSNSSLFLDSSSTIYVLDRPELISMLKKIKKRKNVFYISKLEKIKKKINLFYFGSSIQYLNINEVIHQVFKFMPTYLVFTNNLYTKEKKSFYTVQNNIINEHIPYCIYNYKTFIKFFVKKYDLIKVITNPNPYFIKSKNYNNFDMDLISLIFKLKQKS